MPSGLRWTLLALAGLAVALGVALLASSLASQRIGLADEPVRAGEALAPPEGQEGPGSDEGGSHRHGGGEPPTAPAAPTTTAQPPATTTWTTTPTSTTAPPAQTSTADTTTGEDRGGEREPDD